MKDPITLSRYNHMPVAACAALTTEQRRQLIRSIPDRFWHSDVVALLVNDDLLAYGDLLRLPALSNHHLSPLRGSPDHKWAQKAILALDAGYAPEKVARAARGASYGWAGDESVMWNEWANHFEKLSSHPDSRIRRVAEIGRDDALERKAAALAEEQRESVFGV